jgi:hypothetical protein
MAATTAARATIGNTGPVPLRFPCVSSAKPATMPDACIAGNRERQRLLFALQTAT